jgi:uncharacterized protein (DUF3820 family)
MDPLNTHGYEMRIGRHRGELITRVPVSYLKWMVRERHAEGAYAAAELDRRGTVTPEIEVSGHAIDSASLRCRKIWHETRGEDEGLHAWLCRMAAAALAGGKPDGDKTYFEGMLFAFDRDGEWPILKTIMRKKGGKHAASEAAEVVAPTQSPTFEGA